MIETILLILNMIAMSIHHNKVLTRIIIWIIILGFIFRCAFITYKTILCIKRSVHLRLGKVLSINKFVLFEHIYFFIFIISVHSIVYTLRFSFVVSSVDKYSIPSEEKLILFGSFAGSVSNSYYYSIIVLLSPSYYEFFDF